MRCLGSIVRSLAVLIFAVSALAQTPGRFESEAGGGIEAIGESGDVATGPTVTLVEGSNVTISRSGNSITITAAVAGGGDGDWTNYTGFVTITDAGDAAHWLSSDGGDSLSISIADDGRVTLTTPTGDFLFSQQVNIRYVLSDTVAAFTAGSDYEMLARGAGDYILDDTLFVTGNLDVDDVLEGDVITENGVGVPNHNELGTGGLIVQTSAGNYAQRTITEGNYLDVSDGDGVGGNPTVAFDPTELTAVTWSAGGSASFAWTYDVSTGTDPVITFGDGIVDFSTGASFANAATSAGYIRLYEDSDNGSNYVDLIAPASIGSNATLTLPSVSSATLIYSGGAFHDGFSDFVANEHINHTSVSVSGGNGLTGGGQITANVTLNVASGSDDISVTANAITFVPGNVSLSEFAGLLVSSQVDSVGDNGIVTNRSSENIGDTTYVLAFLDTTATNEGTGSDLSLVKEAEGAFMVYESYALDDASDDTLIFAVNLTSAVDSLEAITINARANASTGSYRMIFAWEFLNNDDPVSNIATLANSEDFAISAPSASGDFRSYKYSLGVGSTKDATGARKLIGMVIRDGDGTTGTDDASGDFDIEPEILFDFSRRRGQ